MFSEGEAVNKVEAREILRQQIAAYERRTYADLVGLIGKTFVGEVTGSSGTRYQIELEALWDSKPNGDLRIIGCIDDGGLRAFFPVTDDFIISPDGHVV
jgi:hypothetical protein